MINSDARVHFTKKAIGKKDGDVNQLENEVEFTNINGLNLVLIFHSCYPEDSQEVELLKTSP